MKVFYVLLFVFSNFFLMGIYCFCKKKEISIFKEYGIVFPTSNKSLILPCAGHWLVGTKYNSLHSVHCSVGGGWSPVSCHFPDSLASWPKLDAASGKH